MTIHRAIAFHRKVLLEIAEAEREWRARQHLREIDRQPQK